MNREQLEEHIADLQDQKWRRLALLFRNVRDLQLELLSEDPELSAIKNEITTVHNEHYDELLGKIVDCAARQQS